MDAIVSRADGAAEEGHAGEGGPSQPGLGKPASLSRGGVSWSLFEGGRTPYVILVMIYVFVPYVAMTIIGDPVRGQETISRWSQYAGWFVMLTAPIIGASIDQIGRRKAALALIVAAAVAMMASLWWARADGTGLSITVIMLLLTAISVLLTYSEVLHNSLLVRAAGRQGAHLASGLGLALGAAFAVMVLAFNAWAFVLPGRVDWAFVPTAPLFGLSQVQHEPERIVGPMAAAIFAIAAVPFFLFSPDARPTGTPVLRGVGVGVVNLWRLLGSMRGHRDAAIFLASRMFFYDGMTAIVVFMGVYASGVMHWGALEMLLYGVLMTLFAVIGGFLARWLDARLGPKRALQIEVSVTLLGLVAQLGMASDRILFFWTVHDPSRWIVWNGPVFRSLPEWIFILAGLLNATFVTAHYASSRTLLTRLTPPDRTGAFFGIYALSGAATSWLAPTLVNRGTQVFHSQQGGFATLTVLLALGLAGLAFIRTDQADGV